MSKTRLRAMASAVALAALAANGPPHAPARPGVTAGGITLTSATIALPADPQSFPPGKGVDVAKRVCTACHSVSMILTQPPLTPEQWTAEIRKMAEAYKARITPEEAEAVHAYLVGLTAAETEAGPAH